MIYGFQSTITNATTPSARIARYTLPVMRAMSGKSIEVINTDAEGRLILADAIAYARQQGLSPIVDVATLTGAMVIAIGKAATGCMSNNQELCQKVIAAGEAAGVTLATQVYVKPGELMVRAADHQPQVGTRFRANLFWMGRAPLLPEKKYKLKLGAARTTLQLVKVLNVMDASDLVQATDRRRVERHSLELYRRARDQNAGGPKKDS